MKQLWKLSETEVGFLRVILFQSFSAISPGLAAAI